MLLVLDTLNIYAAAFDPALPIVGDQITCAACLPLTAVRVTTAAHSLYCLTMVQCTNSKRVCTHVRVLCKRWQVHSTARNQG
jgi:hypothetical protein